MNDLRNLARSSDGRVIHRSDCRHARAPWYWADNATANELLAAKLNMGYRTCRICQPSLFLPSDIDALDPTVRDNNQGPAERGTGRRVDRESAVTTLVDVMRLVLEEAEKIEIPIEEWMSMGFTFRLESDRAYVESIWLKTVGETE